MHRLKEIDNAIIADSVLQKQNAIPMSPETEEFISVKAI